jgi:hypothetical protein
MFRLVTDFNARQMNWQRLTTRAQAFRFGDCITWLLISELFDFCFDGR